MRKNRSNNSVVSAEAMTMAASRTMMLRGINLHRIAHFSVVEWPYLMLFILMIKDSQSTGLFHREISVGGPVAARGNKAKLRLWKANTSPS